MTREFKILLVLSGMVIILIAILGISLRINNRRYEKLENQMYEYKLKQDTLSRFNKDFIKDLDDKQIQMDSIYLLAKSKSNETYIIVKWDSVFLDIVSNPDTKQMSEYLRWLANQE